MKEVSFGISHMMRATPAFIGRLRMAMNVGIIGFMPLIGDAATEFGISEKKLQLIIAVAGVGLNFVSTMFGVPIDGKSVPTSEVTEIETGKP